ncbi:hypothetical protein HN873_058611, partial [Arachis hypogaea]
PILTNVGIHLAVPLACSMPLVLVHAILWIGFYDFEVVDYDTGSAATSRKGALLFVVRE